MQLPSGRLAAGYLRNATLVSGAPAREITRPPCASTSGMPALSMASFGLVHHFEVLVRNAIDGTLSAGQPEVPIKETWLVDFDTLRPDGIRQVITAIDRLEKRREVTRSRVVAGLSFAFWADLFGRHYEDLWRRRLHTAFPHGAVTRRTMSVQMRRIRQFRNRIAHHDSLLDQDVPALVDDMPRSPAGSTRRPAGGWKRKPAQPRSPDSYRGSHPCQPAPRDLLT